MDLDKDIQVTESEIPTQAETDDNERYVKIMRISDIIIDPEISKIFKIDLRIKDEVRDSIIKNGYDKSQPIIIWKDQFILTDGHTRLCAAKEAGLDEIIVTEKKFINREAAILYAIDRQVMRRNLTSSEILRAVEIFPNYSNKWGEGNRHKELAKRLGVSEATIFQVKDIIKNSTEEDKKAVVDGKMSIYSASEKNRIKRAKEQGRLQQLPLVQKSIKLKGAVLLLIQADHKPAAELLINHYLQKDESKEEYLKLIQL